jgi:hypothetical protein
MNDRHLESETALGHLESETDVVHLDRRCDGRRFFRYRVDGLQASSTGAMDFRPQVQVRWTCKCLEGDNPTGMHSGLNPDQGASTSTGKYQAPNFRALLTSRLTEPVRDGHSCSR